MIKLMLFSYIRDGIDDYLPGKLWYWYAPFILLGFYIFFVVLRFNPNNSVPFIILPAQSFDFGMHEFAHILTAFLPSLLTAFAGSGSELLLGTSLVIGAFWTKSYFAVMLCCLWFMLACQSVGIYMADARAQNLNLVSLGGALSGTDKATHDWNFIFGKLYMLQYDRLIGGAVRGVGILVGLLGLIFVTWIVIRMAAANDPDNKQLTSKEKALIGETKGVAGIAGAPPSYTVDPTRSVYPDAHRGVLAQNDSKPEASPKEKKV